MPAVSSTEPLLPSALVKPISGIFSTPTAQSSQHADAMALHSLLRRSFEVHSCASAAPTVYKQNEMLVAAQCGVQGF